MFENCIKKNLPVILVEYNLSNFDKIYVFLKKKYECYFYNFDENKLKKLKFSLITFQIR